MQPELPDSLYAKEASPSEWYAIYTRHQHEKTVAQILASKGFEPFLPLYVKSTRWSDRTKLVSLPLFPCYVFIKWAMERRLDLLSTPGIHSLVSYADRPAPIPSNQIEAIRRAVESGLCFEPHPFLKCGDRVRVKEGPLEGVQGILVRKNKLFRIVLSVEMLGKAVAMEIDESAVERMESNQEAIGVDDNSGQIVVASPTRRSKFSHLELQKTSGWSSGRMVP